MHNAVPKSVSSRRIWKFAAEYQVRNAFQKDRKALGKWLKTELVALGPAFIKMGQFLSTRQDALEKDVLLEIRGLQDDIAPVAFDDIRAVVEAELGKPLDEVFHTFEKEPLATASIGQVHLATLQHKDSTKRDQVCVKIQKPYVAEQITSDISTLQDINAFLKRIGFRRVNEFSSVVDQYEQFLSGELNYKNECDNMDRFRKTVVGMNVRVPQTYHAFTTQKLLTMEYVPSIKITDVEYMRANDIDPEWVADNLIYVFLYTIAKTGFVHCDPHPGNIGVTDDGETIVLYDFGNMIQLNPTFLKQINNLIVSVYQKDVDEFIDLLMKLRVVVVSDPSEVMELKTFFAYFFDYLESLDFTSLKTSILSNESLKQTNLSVKIDNTFLSLFRVFSLLDGTCTMLSPSFNYINSLQPFTTDIFSDMEFIDYRMKKDMQKITSISPTIRNTEQSVMRVSKTVSKLSNQAAYTRVLMGALVVLQSVNDPEKEKLILALPILLMLFFID